MVVHLTKTGTGTGSDVFMEYTLKNAQISDYQAQLALARDVLDRDLENDADFNRYCIRLNPLHELSYTRETIKELRVLAGRVHRLEKAAIRRNRRASRRANKDARQWSNTMMRQQQYNGFPHDIRISAGEARRFAREADNYRRKIVRIDIDRRGRAGCLD